MSLLFDLTDEPCQGFIKYATTPSITFGGDGTTCIPLVANVNISAASGNTLSILGDGLFATATLTPPAGSNSEIQFNNNGIFGATSGLTWDGTNLVAPSLSITNLQSEGDSLIFANENGILGILPLPGKEDITYISGNTSVSASDVYFVVDTSAGSVVIFVDPTVTGKTNFIVKKKGTDINGISIVMISGNLFADNGPQSTYFFYGPGAAVNVKTDLTDAYIS